MSKPLCTRGLRPGGFVHPKALLGPRAGVHLMIIVAAAMAFVGTSMVLLRDASEPASWVHPALSIDRAESRPDLAIGDADDPRPRPILARPFRRDSDEDRKWSLSFERRLAEDYEAYLAAQIGELSVTGRVVDGQGVPVPDADVFLAPWCDPPESVETRNAAADERLAQTGRDGVFHLYAPSKASRYVVRARKTGYAAMAGIMVRDGERDVDLVFAP